MEHPAEAKREWYPAKVVAVHADTWEVDVLALHASAGTVRRVKVQGHYLPEPASDVLDSKVIVGWLDAYQQAPVAVPVHNTMIPDDQKANHVFWSEHLKFRIRITRDGVLEIRNSKGPLLQLRVLEEDGVIRLDTPKTHFVQKDADGSVSIDCEGNLSADAGGNVAVTAKGNLSAKAEGTVDVEAGGNATVKAPVISLDGDVILSGNLAVFGNVVATGTVIDTGGNTNHHSHGG